MELTISKVLKWDAPIHVYSSSLSCDLGCYRDHPDRSPSRHLSPSCFSFLSSPFVPWVRPSSLHLVELVLPNQNIREAVWNLHVVKNCSLLPQTTRLSLERWTSALASLASVSAWIKRKIIVTMVSWLGVFNSMVNEPSVLAMHLKLSYYQGKPPPSSLSFGHCCQAGRGLLCGSRLYLEASLPNGRILLQRIQTMLWGCRSFPAWTLLLRSLLAPRWRCLSFLWQNATCQRKQIQNEMLIQKQCPPEIEFNIERKSPSQINCNERFLLFWHYALKIEIKNKPLQPWLSILFKRSFCCHSLLFLLTWHPLRCVLHQVASFHPEWTSFAVKMLC